MLPSPLVLKSLSPEQSSSSFKPIPKNRIDRVDLFIHVFNNKDGKDKIIKIIQYACRVIVWVDMKRYIRDLVLSSGPSGSSRSGSPGSGSPKRKTLTQTALIYLIIIKWAKTIIPQFSMFRKIMRFGNWFEPIHNIGHISTDLISAAKTKQCSSTTSTSLPSFDSILQTKVYTTHFLNDAIEIYNALFDDIYLFTKFGLFKHNPHLGHWADRHANGAWLAAIFVALFGEYKNLWIQDELYNKLLNKSSSSKSSSSSESSSLIDNNNNNEKQTSNKLNFKEIYIISEKRRLSLLNILKLFCDMTFCTIDLFELEKLVNPIIPTAAGLTSAIVGYYKIYHKLYQAKLLA